MIMQKKNIFGNIFTLDVMKLAVNRIIFDIYFFLAKFMVCLH